MQKVATTTIHKSPPPPLHFVGGKRWLLPRLAELIGPALAEGSCLIEPFVGGMSVALGLRPKHAILSDVNPHVINLYLYLHLQQGHLDETIRSFDHLPPEQADRLRSDEYYGARSQFNHLIRTHQECTASAARLFWYLNRTGYNGLCRFSKSGRYNVPLGTKRVDGLRLDGEAYREVLAGWLFLCEDFSAIDPTGDTVVYADPPYDGTFADYFHSSSRAVGAPVMNLPAADDVRNESTMSGGFTWDDQVRLLAWLDGCARVVASNNATDRIITAYKAAGFTIEAVKARRNVNSNGAGRGPVDEVLMWKGLP